LGETRKGGGQPTGGEAQQEWTKERHGNQRGWVVTFQQRAPRPRVDNHTATSEEAARVKVVVERWARLSRRNFQTDVETACRESR
jgi:hypothetical protein